MERHEFVVVSRAHQARLVLSGDGERAGVVFRDRQEEGPAARAGTTLWDLLRAAGVNANGVNCFEVYERSLDGKLLASLRPVLEGARVVWLVLFRADKEASAFRAIGSRQRIGDALDACFAELRKEVVRPHKP